MNPHIIRVKVTKGLYRWTCSCGQDGRRGYGFIGLAERYGNDHARMKGAGR